MHAHQLMLFVFLMVLKVKVIIHLKDNQYHQFCQQVRWWSLYCYNKFAIVISINARTAIEKKNHKQNKLHLLADKRRAEPLHMLLHVHCSLLITIYDYYHFVTKCNITIIFINKWFSATLVMQVTFKCQNWRRWRCRL